MKSNPQSWLNIADLPRIGLGFVGLLYALGFLVVTFHLSQFGVAPVTWLRPQYLVAGIWCLLPVLLFTAGLAFAGLQFTEPWIRGSMVVPRKTRIYRHCMGAIQGFGSLIASFAFISVAISTVAGLSFHGQYRWSPSSVITLKLAALSFATTASATLAIAAFSSCINYPPESRRVDRSLAYISLGILAVFAFLCFIVLYVHTFSVSVYPDIPSTLGGGRPQRVIFLIESTIHQPAPLVVDSSGTRSIPYNLLLITDTSYVVESLSTNELAIEFKQDFVRGMIVLR